MLKFLLIGAAGAALALAPQAGGDGAADDGPIMAEVAEWQFDAFFELPEVPEPSGLCFRPDTRTLFVVDDGGIGREPGLYEIDQDCKVLRSLRFGKDLEGVCFCGLNGHVFVCDEADSRIWVVDVSGPEMWLRSYCTVSEEYRGEPFLTSGGNGFEGIEFFPDDRGGGSFMLLNQDDPHALVKVRLETVMAASEGQEIPIDGAWTLEPINCGELCYDAEKNELWIVHSWMNTAEVISPDTLELIRWEVMPGAAQEGLCFDDQGRMWVGQDLGGVARYVLGEASADV